MSNRYAAPSQTLVETSVVDGSGLLQITLSLMLVLALIFLIGWLMRRVRQGMGAGRGQLRIVDEISVGARERVVTLETMGVRLVLGVAQGQVSLLHRYAAPTADSAETPGTALTPVESGAGASRWLSVLRQGLGR